MKFIEEIRIRKEFLKNIIDKIRLELKDAPKEKLRVSKNGNSAQYYILSSEISKERVNGKYLKTSEVGIAKKIAQRDYDKKILEKAEKELNMLEKINDNICLDLSEVYSKQNDYRKALINPYVLPDMEYIEDWLRDEYKGLEYKNDIEIYSVNGEKVRSKSEKIIADSLYYNEIPYKYEKPLNIDGVIVYPDFTVLNVKERKEIYWEHFGMMDNEEYLKNAIKKLQIYECSGYHMGEQVVYSFETKHTPLNSKYIENIINYYFK